MGVFKKGADANRLDTIIGPGTICEGSITSKESLCVEGTVRGKIICEGSVVVGEKGRVDADIAADLVILNGMVNGHIVAKTKLEITTNGKLKGDIKTIARDGAVKLKSFNSEDELNPVAQLRPSMYDVVSDSVVIYLKIEKKLTPI